MSAYHRTAIYSYPSATLNAACRGERLIALPFPGWSILFEWSADVWALVDDGLDS